MCRLILEIVKKGTVSMTIVAATWMLVPPLGELGDGLTQSIVVLSFYVYCFIILFSPSPDKLFHVLSIPFLTQFIHIFQRYSFPAGANSLWRLIPFLLLSTYLILFLASHRSFTTATQKYFLFLWIVIQSFFLVRSPQLDMIIGGGITIYLFTLPLYFLYFQYVSMAPDFDIELEKYLFILFLILGFGTLGLVYTGASYMGSDNLLVTRNIADTNITMAYFILLWPFALVFALRSIRPLIPVTVVFSVFIGIVLLSFSRGALFIGVPLLAASLALTGRYWMLLPALILVLTQNSYVKNIISELQLDYSWSLRFSDIPGPGSPWEKLQTGSGRLEIQTQAWQFFLEKPLLGHGTGSFEYLGSGFREAHSLFYTMLAEQGVSGALFLYGILFYLLIHLLKNHRRSPTLLLSFLSYLLYNHTVGSVFVILPAKSISVNCIAPMLLLCLYFYRGTRTYTYIKPHPLTR